jgi:hypothetical protein
MARARTWTVPFNLDEHNAIFSEFEEDADVAAWARGLNRGVNGWALREDPPPSPAMLAGYKFGLGCRLKAEEFRESQKAGGQKSAETRARKFGTPQPPRSCLEVTSKPPRSCIEATSNLSNIHNPIETRPDQDANFVGTRTPGGQPTPLHPRVDQDDDIPFEEDFA